MAVYEVFSYPELRRYKTQVCTKATIFLIFCIFLTYVPPILISYRSQGFWLTEDEYREQPTVEFQHEMIVIADESTSSKPLVWSTYEVFNRIFEPYLRTNLIKARSEDTNFDGKPDLLRLNIQIPLNSAEKIDHLQILLFFNYKLEKLSRFLMQSFVHIDEASGSNGNNLKFVADLVLNQKTALAHRGTDTSYNVSIIDWSLYSTQAFKVDQIIDTFFARNFTTTARKLYGFWSRNDASTSYFTAEIIINFPEQVLRYRTGFWQLLKVAWIQYISLLVPFYYILKQIKAFVFHNQLVETYVESALNKKRM